VNYWLLTTEFPPLFGGGIGTYCQQWTRVLAEQGQQVTVFVPGPVGEYTIEHHNGIRVVQFSAYLADASFLGHETRVSASFAAIVEEFMAKEGLPDWVEAQEYHGIAYFILQKKHMGYEGFRDLRVLVTCHCPSFLTFEHNHVSTFRLPYFWIGEMERFCIKAADLCVSPSRYLSDTLKSYFYVGRRIHVVHNPYYMDEAAGQESTVEKAVFPAKLSLAKGVFFTLKQFQQWWDEGSRVKLQLVGDKYYFFHAIQSMTGAFLEKKYAKYIREGLLELTGALEPAKLKKELASARVVLVPSTIENFPYTVLESMAQGKIVLAAAQGGQSEIIEDGVNGFLFTHEDPQSFTERLRLVFEMEEDELEEMGRRARETVSLHCDPVAYYNTKMSLLEGFRPRREPRDFPFVTMLPVKKLLPPIGVPALLSVVIPYYNMGRWVNETIQSILESGHPNKEIILVNDGSNQPESLKALEKFRGKLGITVIDQPNQGLPSARNTGALAARGEFLAFLDADDQVDPQYYPRAIALMRQKPNLYFVGCWVKYIGDSVGTWPAFNPEPPYLLYHNMVNSSGLVHRRSSFLEAGMNDPQFVYGMEDYDSVLSLVKNGYRGAVLPEPLFIYRVRKDSMARGFNRENTTYLYQLLAQKHKEFYASFAPEIASLLNANGPGYDKDNPTLDYHLYSANSTYGRVIRRIIAMVKRQPKLRKIALTIKRKF
jgi:glycosyltransferase involved in cell wall biosynthesis